MLYFIISLIGLFIGGLLSYISPKEMKDGEKYFKLICFATIITLIIVGFVYSFNIWLFIIGLILGIFFYNEYLYFGIFSVSMLISGRNPILVSSLIFIYGLPSGSLLYHKKRYLCFLSNTLLFFISFLLYFTSIDFTSLAVGGLAGIIIRRLKKGNLF